MFEKRIAVAVTANAQTRWVVGLGIRRCSGVLSCFVCVCVCVGSCGCADTPIHPPSAHIFVLGSQRRSTSGSGAAIDPVNFYSNNQSEGSANGSSSRRAKSNTQSEGSSQRAPSTRAYGRSSAGSERSTRSNGKSRGYAQCAAATTASNPNPFTMAASSRSSSRRTQQRKEPQEPITIDLCDDDSGLRRGVLALAPQSPPVACESGLQHSVVA